MVFMAPPALRKQRHVQIDQSGAWLDHRWCYQDSIFLLLLLRSLALFLRRLVARWPQSFSHYFKISRKQKTQLASVLAFPGKFSPCSWSLHGSHAHPWTSHWSRLGDCVALIGFDPGSSSTPQHTERQGGGAGGGWSFQRAIRVSFQQEGDVYPWDKI